MVELALITRSNWPLCAHRNSSHYCVTYVSKEIIHHGPLLNISACCTKVKFLCFTNKHASHRWTVRSHITCHKQWQVTHKIQAKRVIFSTAVFMDASMWTHADAHSGLSSKKGLDPNIWSLTLGDTTPISTAFFKTTWDSFEGDAWSGAKELNPPLKPFRQKQGQASPNATEEAVTSCHQW